MGHSKQGTSMIRQDEKDDNVWDKFYKHICRDERLNISAIGLMAKLLSHNREIGKYTIHKYVEQAQSGLGNMAFNRVWKTLMDAKYIVKSRNAKGGIHWYIDYNPENYTNWKNTYKQSDEFIGEVV